MTRTLTMLAFISLVLSVTPADARESRERSAEIELPAYLQCVPFARERSGVQIYGDAHTWWDQADGRFERGNHPEKGAVMAFSASGAMQLGHVATVNRIIDKRTVLIDHANWSPINGRRGQIERNVKAIDVSPDNDWSEVRVWYAPIGDIGATVWPVEGFIYGNGKGNAKSSYRLARAAVSPTPAPARKLSMEFTSAFASLGPPAKADREPNGSVTTPHRSAQQITARVQGSRKPEPLNAVLARYD